MKRRPYRLANIAAIGVSLTVAVASVWWRETFGPNAVASLGGLVALICFILFQALYDTQAEAAFGVVHARITGESDRAHARIDLVEARLSALEADATPPHGIPTLKP